MGWVANNVVRVNQLTAGGWFPRVDCGEAVDIAILAMAHAPQPIRAAENFAARYGNISGGTDGVPNQDFLRSCGIPCHTGYGDFQGALSRHHVYMLAIHDDANANPNPAGPYAHWVLVYGNDGQQTFIMNPWGGRLQAIRTDWLLASSQDYGIEINMTLPDDGGATTAGVGAMTPDEALKTARGTVQAVYIAVRGGPAESVAALDFWAAKIVAGTANDELGILEELRQGLVNEKATAGSPDEATMRRIANQTIHTALLGAANGVPQQ